MSIMGCNFMLNTQAKGRVANSAANSLQTAKPDENSAAGELGHIMPKPLIFPTFSASRGCFLTAERRFLPDSREIGSFAP
jgi:hypothetical protein